ncbi:hypothetical protein WA026_013929 [Henosepilachna vigintioctopunctata]|uniref:Uncharacterized protein n=1 Tax=Henosepilachna vigintioctopunctata TaxID=420089 RepID=A0AAW1UB81_9CUCU
MKVDSIYLYFCVLIVSIQGYSWDKYLDEKFFENYKGLRNDFGKFSESLKNNTFFIASFNIFVDKFFLNWDTLLKKLNLDPLGMKDVTQGYWWGNIMLRNIYLEGMSTFRRSGDVLLKYNKDNHQLRLDVPIGIGNIKFECFFKAALIGIGPSGTVTGTVDEIDLVLSIVIDFNVYQAVMNEYNIIKSGHVALKLRGNILTEWVLKLLIGTTTYLFEGIASGALELVAGGAMKNAVDVVNIVLDVVSLL